MKKSWAVLAGFLVLAAFWFRREAFGGFLFCFGDLTNYFYPYRYCMSLAVRHGALPLWNPFIHLGFPFLATLQPGVFYPLSLLYYILPFDAAFNWFLIIHYPLAGFFMYRLGKDLQLSGTAALASGLVFAFSGYLASVLHMPTTLASVTWLPLVFLFWRRLVSGTGDRRLNIAVAGLLLAIMFLGGEPTVLYGTVWALLAYLVYKKSGDWPGLVRPGLSLLAALALAAGLTAVQLLPFAELLLHSVRAGGLAYAETVKYSIPPAKMGGLFLPFFALAGASPWLDSGWLKDLYLGFLAGLLAVFALVRLPARPRWWLAGALLLVLLVCAGSLAPLPVYRLLYAAVPGFNLFRYPAKFMFLAAFIVAYLAGRGLDLLPAKLPYRVPLRLGLVVLVFLDLFAVNSGANFSLPARRYHAVPGNVRLLAGDKSEFRYFIAPGAYLKGYVGTAGEYADWGRELDSLRNRLTYDQNMIFGLAALDGYESIKGADQDALGRKLLALDSLDGVRALDLCNVKYLVSAAPFRQPGYRLLTVTPEAYKGGAIYLYENMNVLPRSFYVPAARVVPERGRILDEVFSRGFEPRRELLLEEAVRSPAGFWFTSDWFYPGWKAFVDGKETRIYRANYLFRAVAVPRPDSKVTYVYDPPSFKLGALISLLSLAGTGVLLLRRR